MTDNTKIKSQHKKFVDDSNIIKNDDMNCKYMSHLLYTKILANGKVEMTVQESQIMMQYQNNVHAFIEIIREYDIKNILSILEYLYSIEFEYLVDVIIMWWCLPDINTSFGKKKYNDHYKNLIQQYNYKIIELIDTNILKHFCLETISRTNSIPIHCIDYIWYYMASISMEPEFYNSNNAMHIKITIQDSEYIGFGFNMERLLYLGLGRTNYSKANNPKIPFIKILSTFVTDTNVVKKLLESNTVSNYKTQIININKNIDLYFGDYLNSIPNEILDLLK
ncbi:hypothetical protein CE11_00337 [Megavirus courdo11]|uniref:Uncharacterized protein n=5 Tax=Megamimivirinae TaxID=3044648 RepID=A0A2L2DLX1_MIMIV|nr:hypothetical protein MegaChil _gp0331 [Megavirus chiliensis]AEQ32507.1 hypothetical protein [Megavirus chiliensis]AFX92367.1 hypothetical protein CE11_00337 [Megavirus courdo11]AGD92237.1 hypothetical protein LBA_00317 [Megavirus lba]AVG47166.1 hypothetical protein [Acanthamoeba polyphaga mimivirus]